MTIPTPRRSFLTDGAFWIATAERGVKSFAQTAAITLTASATGLIGVDWQAALSLAGGVAVASVLTSIASGAISDGTPSLATETLTH